MRSRGSVRRAAAATAAARALAAVLTSGGAAPPGAAGATVTRTYTVWHWNVSGHKLNKGRVDDLILAPTDRLVGPAAGPAAGTKPIPTTCSLDGGTTHQPCSDHRILIGTATLEVDLPVTPPAGT